MSDRLSSDDVITQLGAVGPLLAERWAAARETAAAMAAECEALEAQLREKLSARSVHAAEATAIERYIVAASGLPYCGNAGPGPDDERRTADRFAVNTLEQLNRQPRPTSVVRDATVPDGIAVHAFHE